MTTNTHTTDSNEGVKIMSRKRIISVLATEATE
jgi:hypothetical protein